MGMVLINLGNESHTVQLDIHNGSSTGSNAPHSKQHSQQQQQQQQQHAYTAWTLTPGDGPSGKRSLLNGKPLQETIADGKAIKDIPIAGIGIAQDSMALPPLSVTFVATTCSGKDQ